MEDVTDTVFGDIVAGLDQALAHSRDTEVPGLIVHVPRTVDVAAIRKGTGKAQPAFTESIGVPVGTLRQWETHRRQPSVAALVLLERNPRLVEETFGRRG